MLEMKKITEHVGSYLGLVESTGFEVVLDECLGDWEGDYFALVRNGDQYCLVVQGYGSCSGCDPLESIYGEDEKALAEMSDLRDGMFDGVSWRSADEMKHYVDSKDFALEWYFHDSDGRKFVEKLKDYFA